MCLYLVPCRFGTVVTTVFHAVPRDVNLLYRPRSYLPPPPPPSLVISHSPCVLLTPAKKSCFSSPGGDFRTVSSPCRPFFSEAEAKHTAYSTFGSGGARGDGEGGRKETRINESALRREKYGRRGGEGSTGQLALLLGGSIFSALTLPRCTFERGAKQCACP